jgi:PKD repeat protein
MERFLSRFAFTVLLSCLFLNMQAQKKGKINFADPNENFYETQKRINKHFKKYEREIAREQREKADGKGKVGEGDEQELGGYELYKRWESYAEPRVYPSGDKTLISRANEEYQSYLQQNAQNRQSGNNSVLSSTWAALGPFGDPTGGNAGRINAVRFDPTAPNGIWVCTPDGGLWNTSNNGTSWTTNTDQLSPIGNADVVFDPTNALNMYMATGDGDANDSYSVGVLKSTNGGSTWGTTGLTWAVSSGNRIYKMLINPLNKNVIFVASTAGLLRTTNGGTSWATVAAGYFTDLEYRPGDTTTVYSVSSSMWGGSTSFYKSTNGGASFSATATGLPAGNACDRFAIAVTAANANYVYLVGSSAANDGFYGFYQSVNNGGAFSSKSTTPNLLGWASAGNDTGGQGWYTLSVAANPSNANEVIVGGVNTWKTSNGGTNWTLNTHWTGSGAPFAHADCHDLVYKNSTTVYMGCDGGIFYTANSGASWASLSGNMNIAELYKMGNSKTTYSLAIAGHQDNGTNVYTGGWAQTMGGDGMSAFIDWSNDAVRYGEQYQGSFNRTTNSGGSWTAITTGLTGTGAWNTPWHQDPLVANTIYGGRVQMFKSTNQGTSWSQMGTLTGTATVTEFASAPSNSSVMYVIQGGTILWKTVNGGTNWTNVTGTLPVGSAKMSFVAVENDDPNSVWVTFSGYSAGNKVYLSSNGGTTWTNYSTGLPNLPTNCITYWNNTKDGVYVGCDVGVFYRDSTTASWAAYNTGLPNVSVHDLAIFYPTGKIRAATYGRGMWEVDLVAGNQAPIANFTANRTVVCPGMTVNFTDLSSFAPTSWSWTFQGGTPVTSTAQNPSIVYNTPGTYSVSLTATNANGNNTATQVSYITVSTVNALPLVEGFQGATFPPTNWQNYDAGGDALAWAKSSTVGKASTASMLYDNYNLNAAGTRDEMRAPKYNFGGFSVIKLYFDVAYAQYDPTYTDTLAIMVSSDCGVTYSQVYAKGGTTLATAPNYTAATFVPTAAQWRTDTVYLNAYAGMGNVLVSFQNRGHYGQALYVDNINIAGSGSGAAPVASFSNTATLCTGQNVTFTDQSTNVPTSWSWTFSGGVPATSTVQNPVVTFAAAGTHTVTLVSTNAFGSSPVSTQTITITASPTVTVAPATSTVCSGISAILTGGGATNYTWSANAGSVTTNTVSVTPASTMVYTLTGANGTCTSTATSTLTVNATPTVVVNSAAICSGASTVLTASGATTYTWNTGPTTSTISVSPVTTTVYTVTGTTAGCNAAKTSTVTVTTTPVVTITGASTICSGASVVLTGATAATYTWSANAGSVTTSTASVSPASTTTYTLTGANGTCTATAVATVTVNTTPTLTVSGAAICSGASATLTATGATTYTWNTGPTTSTINVTPASTTVYTVTGTSSGCNAVKTATVTVSTTPTVAVNSATVCAGSPALLTASGATTYTWNTGPTTNTISVTPASITVYTVTGSTGGCNSVKTATVTVNATPTVAVNSPAICAGSSTTLTVSGAATYTWNTGPTTSTISVSPASTTVYSVTGTTAGCNAVQTGTVTVTPIPTVAVNNAAICAGATATLTASGATTYSWNTGATTASINVSPASMTVYTVTGTTSGCVGTNTSTVTVSPNPTVAVNSASICSGNSSVLTAGGATTYSWSPAAGLSATTGASVTANPTSTTIYTVTGTTGSCNGTNTSTLTVSPTPTINVNSSTICSGSPTTLTASGAATYSWSPGTGLSATTGASVTANPVSTTIYTITGTTGSCTSTSTSTVTVVASLTVVVNSASICAGSTATLTASGASTYSWNTGATSSSINVSPASNTVYTVTGTSGACNASNTSTVTVTALPTVTASTSSVTICSGQNATLTGGGASTYTWDAAAGSATTSTVSVSPSSTSIYTVTGTTSGCNNTATVSIAVNATPTVAVNSAGICTGNTATLTASGATTFSWSPATGLSATSGTSVTANPASTTIYTITGTTTGCNGVNTSTVTVTVTPTVTVPSGTVCAGSSANLNASGATNYTWNPGGLTGASVVVTPSVTSTYTITGDNGGCIGTPVTATVTVNAVPTISVTAVTDTICSGNSTSINATGGVTYAWSPPAGLSSTSGANVTANPTLTMTYSVTGTDVNGCSSTTPHTLTVFNCTAAGYIINTGGTVLRVFPNPNNGTFIIEIPSGNKEVYTLEIDNALGQLVHTDKIVGDGSKMQKTITLAPEYMGVYILRVSSVSGKQVYRLIVE